MTSLVRQQAIMASESNNQIAEIVRREVRKETLQRERFGRGMSIPGETLRDFPGDQDPQLTLSGVAVEKLDLSKLVEKTLR
jgi:hypothetical protein